MGVAARGENQRKSQDAVVALTGRLPQDRAVGVPPLGYLGPNFSVEGGALYFLSCYRQHRGHAHWLKWITWRALTKYWKGIHYKHKLNVKHGIKRDKRMALSLINKCVMSTPLFSSFGLKGL